MKRLMLGAMLLLCCGMLAAAGEQKPALGPDIIPMIPPDDAMKRELGSLERPWWADRVFVRAGAEVVVVDERGELYRVKLTPVGPEVIFR